MALVVAELVALSLLTPEIRDSNPDISYFFMLPTALYFRKKTTWYRKRGCRDRPIQSNFCWQFVSYSKLPFDPDSNPGLPLVPDVRNPEAVDAVGGWRPPT